MFYVITGILTYGFAIFALVVTIAAMCLYILRDTHKYKMEKLPWIIAVVLLQFLGLCFYWHARKQHLKTFCPVCSAEISGGNEACTRCGVVLETVRPKKFSLGRVIVTVLAVFQAVALIMHFFIML